MNDTQFIQLRALVDIKKRRDWLDKADDKVLSRSYNYIIEKYELSGREEMIELSARIVAAIEYLDRKELQSK